jgi:valyl-tRNA synthetase
MKATDDVYSFWLYEVCDVYIVRLLVFHARRSFSRSPSLSRSLARSQEAIKDITAPDAPLEARRSAQHTLYTVLDNGLRLLHPIMPFVTEELWQRLPRRPTDQTKSIMLARYPVQVSFLSFERG